MYPEIKGLGRKEVISGVVRAKTVQKNTGKKMFTHPVPHVRREWCWLNSLKDARKENEGLAASLHRRSLPLNADKLKRPMQ